jgi:RHS repeat-associated protein
LGVPGGGVDLDGVFYQFSDQERDTYTGLYNYDARLYDPVIGQFMSADTIVPGSGFDPQMLNRFSYVRNNPPIYTDPTGHHLGGYSGPRDYNDFDDNNGGREDCGIDKDEYERDYALNNTTYSRDTKNYYFYDPNEGQKQVKPMVDEIPSFNWHKDRNLFNLVPKKMKKVWQFNGTLFIDRYGNIWKPDNPLAASKYHGYLSGKSTYRGTGYYSGCQATYDRNGELVDEGPHMGTWDYASPSVSKAEHYRLDVKPHNPVESPYTPNLSTQY